MRMKTKKARTAEIIAGATVNSPASTLSEPQLKTMTVAALKELCKRKGLQMSGTKAKLIARLLT